MSAKPDFLIVLSLERTGGTSVFQSLRAAKTGAPLLHVHFLDGDKYREPPKSSAEADGFQIKREREAQARQFLETPGLNGAVFTVVRDPLSRIISCLWFAKHKVISGFYDERTDSFDPRVMDVLGERITLLIDKERNYDREVYQAIGLPGRPQPGLHRTRAGAPLFALDFRHVDKDFAQAAQAFLGRPVPLLHVNAGVGIGDPRGYAAFKRLCAEALPPERLGLVS